VAETLANDLELTVLSRLTSPLRLANPVGFHLMDATLQLPHSEQSMLSPRLARAPSSMPLERRLPCALRRRACVLPARGRDACC